MSSEIEIVEEDAVVQSNDRESAAVNGGNTDNGVAVVGEESLRNDVYTAAAYGDLEKLHRLVESEGCSVSVPDSLGYYALQWAALNNRSAAAQYIIEVCLNFLVFWIGSFLIFLLFYGFVSFACLISLAGGSDLMY